MTNKEKAYKYIQQIFLEDQKSSKNNGVDTQQVADYLKIKRPNASAILNTLVKEKLLSKTSTRPVRYHLSDKVTHDAFDNLIGARGSLAEAVKQAKAAILFPGRILPIQIVAKPGSGTTYFSKLIIQYAKDKKVISKDAKYYEVNCIIEEKNPKLDALLFGTSEHDSILERHQKSIVMINHYEKLNSTQIYQLNHIMDSNPELRRNLVLLSTTPDNPNHLNSPVNIVLPEYNKRPMDEKLKTIEFLFETQASNSKKSLIVNSRIILALVNHKFKGGFKELEKDITLASAKAYLRSIDDHTSEEIINENDFPNDFIFSRTLDIDATLESTQLLKDRENFIFSGSKSNDLDIGINHYDKKLYYKLNQHYHDLSQQGLNPDFIKNSVYHRIEYLFNRYGFPGVNQLRHRDAEENQTLSKIVPSSLIKMTQEFLAQASEQLDQNFSPEIFYGLCLHLNSILVIGNKSNTTLSPKAIAELKQKYSKELQITRNFARKLDRKFNYHFTENEILILLTFLVEPHETKTKKPAVLFALHGNGAAHALSEVVNTLNHNHNAYSYDLSLDKAINQAYQELKHLILKINQGAGVIVIYDMGSFKELFNRIIDETSIDIRMINVPITLIGLETARKALVDPNIDDIYHNVLTNTNNYLSSKVNSKPNLIITLCHTGEGGAVQLRDYINEYSKLGWIVKAMSVSDRQTLADEVMRLRKFYNIKAFIGTYNPNLFGIPFISIVKVFQNSHEDLDKVLSFMPVNTNTTVYNQIYEYYQNSLKFVHVNLLKEIMPDVMEELAVQYNLDRDRQLGIFTHVVGILENGLGGCKRQNIKIPSRVKQNLLADFTYIGHCLKPLEEKFNFVFNESDIYTIIAIIKQI